MMRTGFLNILCYGLVLGNNSGGFIATTRAIPWEWQVQVVWASRVLTDIGACSSSDAGLWIC